MAKQSHTKSSLTTITPEPSSHLTLRVTRRPPAIRSWQPESATQPFAEEDHEEPFLTRYLDFKPKPSRPEAIRRLLDLGLSSNELLKMAPSKGQILVPFETEQGRRPLRYDDKSRS
jgi:hypothetical protein